MKKSFSEADDSGLSHVRDKKNGRVKSRIFIRFFILCIFVLSPMRILLSQAVQVKNENRDLENLFNAETSVQTDQTADRLQVNSGAKTYSLDIMAALDLVGEWDRDQNRELIKKGNHLWSEDQINQFPSGDIPWPPELMALRKMEEWSTPPEHSTQNRAYIRGGEIGFFADIDQIGSGSINIAGSEKDGEATAELEEAYFVFPVTFLPSTSIKLGKFYSDVGRINTIHQHDRDYTTTPLVHEALLGEEGVNSTGIQFSILMPWKLWQELSLGVFNGGEDVIPGFTEPSVTSQPSDDADGLPQTSQKPLYTAHLKQFFPIGPEWGSQLGFSYLQWETKDPKDPLYIENSFIRKNQQSGLDFLLKWKRGKNHSFQWLTEIWYREMRSYSDIAWTTKAPPVETRVGGYTFISYQILEKWKTGVRFDRYQNPNYRGENDYFVPDVISEVSALLGWEPSEFSKFRITVSQVKKSLYKENENRLFLQATFIIGKHPAHAY